MGDSLKTKGRKNRAEARYGRAPCPNHHDRVKTEEKVGWIVKFKRGLGQKVEPIAAANRNYAALGVSNRPLLILSPQSYEKDSQWVPFTPGNFQNPDYFKIRYWNGKKWTVKYHKAHRYHTKEYAEAVAFRLALKEKSLIGELEVEEWVPCSTPKSRRPQSGNALA